MAYSILWSGITPGWGGADIFQGSTAYKANNLPVIL